MTAGCQFLSHGFHALHATPAQRGNYVLSGEVQGIHWPDVDEAVSVPGLIAGQPSVEFKAAFAGPFNSCPHVPSSLRFDSIRSIATK